MRPALALGFKTALTYQDDPKMFVLQLHCRHETVRVVNLGLEPLNNPKTHPFIEFIRILLHFCFLFSIWNTQKPLLPRYHTKVNNGALSGQCSLRGLGPGSRQQPAVTWQHSVA